MPTHPSRVRRRRCCSPSRSRHGGAVAAGTAALVALSAFAARPARADGPEFSLTFLFGTAKTQSSDLRIRQPAQNTDLTYKNVKWDTRPFSGSFYYGYRVEVFPTARAPLGFALDFTHNKVYANPNQVAETSGTFNGEPVSGPTRIGDRVQEFRITNGINTLAFEALYRFKGDSSNRYPFGRVTPYVAVGPALFIDYGINEVNGQKNKHYYDWAGWGFQARGGLRYRLNPDVSVFGELKYTNGPGDVNVAGDGRGTTHLSSLHTVGGLSYQF